MPSDIKTFYHAGYWFGAKAQLPPEMMKQLIDCFQSPGGVAPPRLGGRQSTSRIHLPDIGPVVIKHFRRGGLLALLIEKTYCGIGKKRSQIEFEQMRKARQLGVQTPKPVAFAFRGRIFYQNWLITEQIPAVQSMAALAKTAPLRVEGALHALGRQIGVLIDHGILHADFHPGNVLVDDSGKVYLVDFDKTATYGGSPDMLRSKYRQRWCRAVQKHALPQVLSDTVNSWLG